MQIQTCAYRSEKGGAYKTGLAFMKSGFNSYDVLYIVDIETGEKVPYEGVFDYTLRTGPMDYIDTEYGG